MTKEEVYRQIRQQQIIGKYSIRELVEIRDCVEFAKNLEEDETIKNYLTIIENCFTERILEAREIVAKIDNTKKGE